MVVGGGGGGEGGVYYMWPGYMVIPFCQRRRLLLQSPCLILNINKEGEEKHSVRTER